MVQGAHRGNPLGRNDAKIELLLAKNSPVVGMTQSSRRQESFTLFLGVKSPAPVTCIDLGFLFRAWNVRCLICKKTLLPSG